MPAQRRVGNFDSSYDTIRPDLQMYHVDQANRAIAVGNKGAAVKAARAAGIIPNVYNNQLHAVPTAERARYNDKERGF